MDQKRIDRISELTRLARRRPLTDEEQAERAALRQEYINAFKASLTGQLEHTVILYPDGTRKEVGHKPRKENKHE